MKKLFLAAILVFSLSYSAFAKMPASRYFHSGDGELRLKTTKNKATFEGSYRNPDGSYDKKAMERIHRVFSAKHGVPISEISPRLIEFLDYLEDNLNEGALITIASGFRSPKYNTNLRKKGKLAAKASLHQYGMAADIKISGVNPKRLWNFVRELEFGGTGYYHGSLVHVDVGPARFWDETSSGVGTDISNENKLIELVADKDIYLPGEVMTLRFIRMTAFPIGVNPIFVLEKKGRKGKWKETTKFTPTFRVGTASNCPEFQNIEQMLGMKWELPAKLRKGRYRVVASFCNDRWSEMPDSAATPEFEVAKR